MIQVKLVSTPQQRRAFLTFPWQIYQGDALWVPPLLPQISPRLDPRQSAIFRQGLGQCFMAWKGGEPAGRMCVANDVETNLQRGRRDCVLGFFEYIDDYAVFETLLQFATEWAHKNQLDALYGPFNLDYEDSYGVLIDGRDRPPVLLCGHTPAYYQIFMERYGFEPARGDNLAFEMNLNQENEAIHRLSQSVERVKKSGRLRVRGADFKKYNREVDAVWSLINRALAHLPDFIPWQRRAMEELFDAFRQIADPELILFGEVDGEVVGFFPALPNLNEIFIRCNGLRYPWNYIKYLWLKNYKPQCATIKSVLVLPEFWGSGLALLLFDEMLTRLKARGYLWADLSLTSDDNPKTPMLAERFGAKIYKRYRVYRMAI